jgi:hypothetical protein
LTNEAKIVGASKRGADAFPRVELERVGVTVISMARVDPDGRT